MAEYICTGRATLAGVVFYVTAESVDGARRKFKSGDFGGVEYDEAELIDYDITGSVEENL